MISLPNTTKDQVPLLKIGKPSVLLIDDEERILRSLRILFNKDYNVHLTTDGQQALEMLRTAKIHAIVSDQRMPIMQGVEVLRQAKEISPHTTRLLLTGYSDKEAIAGFINESEIFRFISKPWNNDEIKKTVKEAVDISIELEAKQLAGISLGVLAGPVSVLLIDEDPETFRQLNNLLIEYMAGKCILEWAHDIDSALDILKEKDISLVISEISLYQEDVTQLLKSIKLHYPEVVTLVLTSVLDSSLMVSLINQAQVHRYLLKPIRRNMTLRGIESGINLHFSMKHAPALKARHRVEASNVPPKSMVANRILSFFKNMVN